MYGLWSNISNLLICYLGEVELTDYLDCESVRRNHFLYSEISDLFFYVSFHSVENKLYNTQLYQRGLKVDRNRFVFAKFWFGNRRSFRLKDDSVKQFIPLRINVALTWRIIDNFFSINSLTSSNSLFFFISIVTRKGNRKDSLKFFFRHYVLRRNSTILWEKRSKYPRCYSKPLFNVQAQCVHL